jgi:Holliday junction resolvase-like predicted endonuclease|tara:strand:- start:812 stop:1108 length:297 start_codon:yes stop_codon:yes gene_type:complete
MLQKNKGCLCENIAVCWLQENGYFVFKGCQTHSAIDLVAIHPVTLECEYFDVKIRNRRKDGTEINRVTRIRDSRIQILSVDLDTKKCRIVPRRNIKWS